MYDLIRARTCMMALAVVLMWPTLTVRADMDQAKPPAPGGSGPASPHATRPVVEIRSYNLKAGARDRFHQLFVAEALPMLKRWRVDVVAYGPSLHDSDSWYLMRAYASPEERQRSEDAFYGSEEWKKGPREAILAAIDSYTTVVVRLDEATLRGLRNAR